MTKKKSLLQKELQQTRPFRSPAQEAVLAVLRTADLIRRRFNRVLESHDLTLAQYNVLRILRGAGQQLPTLAIAERLIEQTPGITRMLDRLEAKKLIQRERCAEDRRQVLCELTTKGKSQVRKLDSLIERTENECLDTLAKKDQSILISLLEKVREVQF